MDAATGHNIWYQTSVLHGIYRRFGVACLTPQETTDLYATVQPVLSVMLMHMVRMCGIQLTPRATTDFQAAPYKFTVGYILAMLSVVLLLLSPLHLSAGAAAV